MKFAITGSSGQLGSALVARLKKDQFEPVDRQKLDIRNPSNSLDYLRDIGADVIVHCAANTDVEQCETNPSSAMRDNLALTELVASVASRLGMRVVYFSSTGVYGNWKETAYSELDPTRPTTVHHRSKWLGELAVLRASPFNLVLRTGWLFGGAIHAQRNFVANRIKEALSSDGKIFSDETQFGVPTATFDVASRMLEFVENEMAGLFNLVCEGSASRYEYVAEIIRLSGLDVEVSPVPSSAFRRVAPVSSNEMAVNFRANALGYSAMPNWRDSLSHYVSSIKNQISA